MLELIKSFETSFIYDVPNFVICFLAVLLLSQWVRLPRNYTLLLLGHCFVPFLLNDVLFPATYMGDQFRYANTVREIRDSFSVGNEFGNIANASWLLAFVPLPFVETVSSLGFFNKFIFILTFIFLYKKNVLTTFSAYFLLLYPSLVLYTGLSLRDTIILCCMLLAAYFAIKRNILLVLFWLLPLVFLKFQNFFIMLPLLFFALFNIGSKGMSPKRGFIILALGGIALILSFPVAKPLINLYRMAMYREDGGQNLSEVPVIETIGDFLALGLTSGLYFFIKPLPWESTKALQLIQSFENLMIMAIVIKLTIKAWYLNVRKLIFWLVLFIGSLSIYGLVVFNYGTAARYRFPFILIYVIFVCYTCNIDKVFNFTFRQPKK